MGFVRYFPPPPLNAYIEDLYYLDGPAPYPRQKVFARGILKLDDQLRPHFRRV